MSTPIYTHDCTQCRFLGAMRDSFASTDRTDQMVDVYLCPKGLGAEGSLVVRFGHEGPDYTSAPVSLAQKVEEGPLADAFQLYNALKQESAR